MVLFRRRGRPADNITPQELADFGRWQFLRDRSGVDPARVQDFVSRLIPMAASQNPTDRSTLVAGLRRCAERGAWEKIGAWQIVREFMDETPETQPLIDDAMLALARMRVTNLRYHLAPRDIPHYERVTGTPVPHDGFVGPPVFYSSYGPSRQYYFDHAVSAAAARTPSRIRSAQGIEPGTIDKAAQAMWDFGLLVHRGPHVVSPAIAFEPTVLRPAVIAATNVDHNRFAEVLVAKALELSKGYDAPWPALGAARFIEDYLDVTAAETPAYRRALDEGLRRLMARGDLNVTITVEVLSPPARARLEQLKAEWP